MIDKDPRTAELESGCVHMLADVWNSPDLANTMGCSTTGSSEATRPRAAGPGLSPLPAERRDLVVQRVVARLGVSRDLAGLLVEDLRSAIEHFEEIPSPNRSPVKMLEAITIPDLAFHDQRSSTSSKNLPGILFWRSETRIW